VRAIEGDVEVLKGKKKRYQKEERRRV